MRYYIVFLHFDADIHRIDTFDNEEAFNKAVTTAEEAQVRMLRDDPYRDWFSFSTWSEPV